MAIDPICGMEVDESTDLTVDRDGQTYYFCCRHCLEKFVALARSVGEDELHQPGAHPRATTNRQTNTSARCAKG